MTGTAFAEVFMRTVVVLFATLALVACSSATVSPAAASTGEASLDPVVDVLLNAAATDFHTHRPPDPAAFRNLRVGHVMTASGEEQAMLCGEFLPAHGGDAGWMPFATIKTDPYEQWMGRQAAGVCEGSAVVWKTTGDLSSSLQSRLDGLRKVTTVGESVGSQPPSDFVAFLDGVDRAQLEFQQGRPEAYKSFWSQQSDVTLGGGFGGGFERGWGDVSRRLDWASAQFKDGRNEIQRIAWSASGDLGYLIQAEHLHFTAPASGAPVERVYRVTMLFRREKGEWRIIHRHADTQTSRETPR